MTKQKTAMTLLIELLEDTKKTKCKTLQEVVFFDGVLALIDVGEFKAKEREQIIAAVKYMGYDGENYFNQTFEP